MMLSPFFIFVFALLTTPPPASPINTDAPGWLYDGTIQMMAAAERCRVKDCTCRVTRGASTASATEVADSRRHYVYFQENEFGLEAAQESTIHTFTSKFRGSAQVNVTLVGYADGCGSPDENRILSSQRARVVTNQIKRTLPNASVTFRGAGESSVEHDPRSRRVDILVEVKSNVESSIERVPADVYLIDASGSLWDGWAGWRNVVNASFRPGSRIYVSKMSGCRDGMSIDSVTPAGGTEIWWSYWTVLDHMHPGETLAIISDFDSNYPLLDWEHRAIEKKVREKGVKVIVIRL